MNQARLSTALLGASLLVFTNQSLAATNSEIFQKGSDAILKQTGCYIVDYNFVETDSLKQGYKTDNRVYDTNSDKTTYELILPIQKSPTEIRLQHVLFMKDLKTGEVKGLIKHHAEDWSYEQDYAFDFVSPGNWQIKTNEIPNAWVRKTTNLDDGLRYQCAAAWDLSTVNPEWNCANYAPIPGRETRDMGRKDYNTLDRNSRVIVYKSSWVERQSNIKTIYADGVKTPLAKENGRTTYIRQADSECAEAAAYAQQNAPYWKVLMDVWEEYYAKKQAWSEKSAVNNKPRFAAMYEVEDKYAEALAIDASKTDEAKAAIRQVIESYRN